MVPEFLKQQIVCLAFKGNGDGNHYDGQQGVMYSAHKAVGSVPCSQGIECANSPQRR